jgi:hypothetical protein
MACILDENENSSSSIIVKQKLLFNITNYYLHCVSDTWASFYKAFWTRNL